MATLLGGCSAIIGSAMQGLASDLSTAILDNDDPATVRDGAPAYLIMIDAILESAPNNPALLRAGADLNGAYATAFVTDPARSRLLADKAFGYAGRASCAVLKWLCDVRTMPFEELSQNLETTQQKHTVVLYNLASAWAGWIQAYRDDWSAIAELARVKALMLRVAHFDPGYEYGSPMMYLGALETLVPAALGGKPEVGREYFERAIELSGGRHLMAPVLLAEQYARLVFDRELHDRVLLQVIEAEARVQGLTLINQIAKERARKLLETADDYF